MQYMGSKNRHAKEILPIILKDRVEGQYYVEPFVGGANMIDKVDGPRIGNDIHPHLICLLRAAAVGWIPPESVTEEEYRSAKSSMQVTPYVGFVGFLCSFGAKWFNGYARNSKNRDYVRTGRNAIIKQSPNLSGIDFVCSSYRDMKIPRNSIVYCDPPYEGATKYANDFDHYDFWNWCRELCIEGHRVFISEYNSPDDFVSVWEKSSSANLSSKRKSSSHRVERLFVHNSQA